MPVRVLQHVAEDLYLVRGGDDAHLGNYVAVARGKESWHSVAVDDDGRSSIGSENGDKVDKVIQSINATIRKLDSELDADFEAIIEAPKGAQS